MSIRDKLTHLYVFKAYGNHRFGIRWTEREYADQRPLMHSTYMSRKGNVTRIHNGKVVGRMGHWHVHPRYRPYRQLYLRVGPIWTTWTQKRPGLGIIPVLRERKARGL